MDIFHCLLLAYNLILLLACFLLDIMQLILQLTDILACKSSGAVTYTCFQSENGTSIVEMHVLFGREGNVLFNDALNTFYFRLYGVRHMV